MIAILVWFVIACAVLGFAHYAIGALVPAEYQKVARVFLALVVLIFMIYLVVGLVGLPGGFGHARFPRS